VIDGGSNDGSVDILKSNQSDLAFWVSERDAGQAHAINKGLKVARGDVVCWINSDDVLLPGVLEHVASAYEQCTSEYFWMVTGVEYVDETTGQRKVDYQREFFDISDWIFGDASLHQQGSFWSRSLHSKFGFMREDLHYGFDKEFFMRLIQGGIRYLADQEFVGGRYRQHSQCKWVAESAGFKRDWAKIAMEYVERGSSSWGEARGVFVHAAIRMALNDRFGRKKRFGHLLEAALTSPRACLRRDFVGALYRCIT
jgi:glycosyltransferase involved in cell wall biosynthesis